MPTTSYLPLILATASLFLACSSSAPPEGTTEAGEQPSLESQGSIDEALAGDWGLVALGEETELAAPVSMTVDPAAGKISGRSACNRYFAPWTAQDGKVAMGAAGSTMMACPDPIMELERRFFQLMESAVGYRLADEELELTDEAGTVVLRFTRAEPTAD